jgi:hypothetical protein
MFIILLTPPRKKMNPYSTTLKAIKTTLNPSIKNRVEMSMFTVELENSLAFFPLWNEPSPVKSYSSASVFTPLIKNR